MNRNLLGISLLAIFAVLFSCNPTPPVSSTNAPSAAFFDIPAALSAEQSGTKSAASDAMVASTMAYYYGCVRGQVHFGADVAAGIKAILQNLEAIEYGDGFLLDSNVNATVTDSSGTIRWQTKDADSYLLEKWDLSNAKLLELDFSRVSGRYYGTAIVSGAVFTAPPSGYKNPDMISVAFDSANPANSGAATLLIKASSFRVHPGLASISALNDDQANGQEDIILSFTRDSSGAVTLGSIGRAVNSRHFVWNGYDYTGALNLSASTETRYYTAAGVCNASGLATVHLGIPATFGSDVFTAYGAGSLVAQLFTDRLNNDYQFDASNTGHGIIDMVNLIPAVSPELDYSNSVSEVILALGQAQGALGTPNDMVDYLVAIMAVTNPAYFDASRYVTYGSAPAGYSTLGDADARAMLPSVTAVDALASGAEPIVFASTAAP